MVDEFLHPSHSGFRSLKIYFYHKADVNKHICQAEVTHLKLQSLRTDNAQCDEQNADSRRSVEASAEANELIEQRDRRPCYHRGHRCHALVVHMPTHTINHCAHPTTHP